ncbi:alpha/beta hydrolase [Raineyella sp. LH-20]|uniref:alpha/beta hydrolase n=1 Tax=Raineyella sp. LH-20 TaxID=3081204 RepID=UPI002953A266|nr:alpha/beta hydrolase [Raineyella sp. LH-20]WOP19348.1 alpha/beta hydrolase [Raineyella sp. LH-20]
MLLTVLAAGAAVVLVGGGAVGWYAWNNTTYAAREAARVRKAGYVEASHVLPSGTRLTFVEGPDNGPAVLLLHAQGSAWQSYDPVLPGLADHFHVYALDVPGHGTSDRTPGRYDVAALGRDVVDFIAEVIGEPVILSGHSSGGLVAARVAAEAPDRVAAVLFEDPPFFSTDPDRAPTTFNYIDLATPAHEFLHQDAEPDFTSYYIAHNAWIGYFGGGRDGIVSYAQRYRRDHPDEPLTLWFLPPRTNESYAHLHEFDPAFADAFFTFGWQQGFDQAATLERIHQPTILVHANWRITDAGILEGAMTDDDAARACGLLTDCRIVRVDTGHGFHVEDPGRFVELMGELVRQGTVAFPSRPEQRGRVTSNFGFRTQ